MSYRRRSLTTSTSSSPATSTYTSSTWTARCGPPSTLLLAATHSSSLTSHYSLLATHDSRLTTEQVWDAVDTSRIPENLKDISTTPSLNVKPKMEAHVFCRAVRQHAQTAVPGSGRAGRPRLEAPSRSHTAGPLGSRAEPRPLGPRTAQPSSLPEAPPESLVSPLWPSQLEDLDPIVTAASTGSDDTIKLDAGEPQPHTLSDAPSFGLWTASSPNLNPGRCAAALLLYTHPPTPQSHPLVATPGDVALLRYGLVAGLVREGRVVLT